MMRIRLLLIEDSEDDALLIQYALEETGFDIFIQRVESVEAFHNALDEAWDLVISDYNLPTCTGIDILHVFKEHQLDIPFILVSGAIREEVAVDAMRDGAHDYVMKDNLARLGPAVRRELAEAQARRTSRRLEAGYRNLVEHSVQGLAIVEGTRLRFVNPALARILGTDREKLVGAAVEKMGEHFHPDDRALAEARLTGQSQAHPDDDNKEIRIRRANGEERWAEVVATRVETDENVVVQTTFVDITRRKHHERELEAIATLAAALRKTKDRPQMVSVLLDQTIKLLGAHGAALATQEQHRSEIEFELARGAWGELVEGRFAASRTLSGQVLATGEPFIGTAAEVADRLAFPAIASETSHLAAVPLTVEDRSIGVLWIGRENSITTSDLRVLTAIADMAASALRRIGLHAETRLRLQRLHALRSVDLAITTSHDLQVVFDVLLEQLLGQIDTDAASILRRITGEKDFVTVASRGKNIPELPEYVSSTVGLAAQVGATRRTLRVEQLVHQPLIGRESTLEKAGFTTYIGFPLVASGELRGVLELFHRGPLELDPEKDAFLETLAWQAAIAVDGACLVEELQVSNLDLAEAYDTTLEGWARALELRDQETEGHTRRVAELAVKLARTLGVAEAELTHIKRGALMHDIGKMAIPDRVLLKPGPLDDAEWEIMRQHPQYAVDMLAPIEYLRPALVIPFGHHERWDGSGYPKGLQGKDIPLPARMFAVIDVWDALCSDRPYRQAWPAEKVTSYISEYAGSLFDPDIVERFLKLVSSLDHSEED
ncbi:MAG: GAF domain-containing protein [bacterium]|nr:GAF domain-containing protein [bacterium]